MITNFRKLEVSDYNESILGVLVLVVSGGVWCGGLSGGRGGGPGAAAARRGARGARARAAAARGRAPARRGAAPPVPARHNMLTTMIMGLIKFS